MWFSFRTETEETLGGRSRCRACRTTIFWYDNIPVVSFLLLRGKCRRCAERISWQYPLVEILTGFLFFLAGLLVFKVGVPATYIEAIWWCFLFSMLLLIAFYDLAKMEIPLSFLLVSIAGTILSFLILSFFFFPLTLGTVLMSPLAQAIFGGSIAALFFYLLVWMSQERWMGMGDVWLAFLAGMAVGPHLILFLLSLSFTLGALIALFLLLTHQKGLSSQVPFAPYLCLATVIILVLTALETPWLSLFLFPPL